MALETGVDIKIEVSGEKLLKQAFDSVRLAAKGLETQGLSLSQTLKKLEGTEKETINTFRKSSDTYKGLQKETVTLAKQYEFMAKFSGISAKEARFLAVAQDDLIKKSKELNIHGAARNSFIDSQNRKIVEQIRLNNQLKSSIDRLTGSSVVANKVIQSVPNQVNRMNNSFNGVGLSLRQLLPTLGGIGLTGVLTTVGITALRTADTMSLLRSRIALVKNESEDFNEVYNRLVSTAINNRSSLQDTATLYVRLTPALRAAGVEASAATKVIDSFQKTLLISGATTRETSSAILQFSQAMAAGRLNGDEFRSISEAAPEFLRAFSRATGVAAGALKELAADGKLTTEVITAAMVIMNDELTRTAANIELTFSQSMTILSTRLSEFVDRANQATGATAALAGFTTDLSDIVKELNTSFSLLDTVSVNESLREMSPEAQAIGYIFETLAVVFLNTGFVLKTLVDTAVTGARQFKALVTGDLDGALKLGDEYNQRAKEGAAFVEKLSNALVGATQRAAQARSELVQTRQSLLDMGYSASEMSGSLDGGSDSTKFLSKEMQDALAIIEKFKKGLSSSGKEAEKFAKTQKKAIESLLDNLTKLEDQYSNYGGKIDDVERSEREIVKAFESGITSAAQYTKQIIRLSKVRQARSEIEYAEAQSEAAVEMNKVLEASDKQTESYKDQVAEIEEQILKVGKQEEALLALELAKIDDIIATKQQKIEMNSFGDANDTLIGQYKEQIAELEKLKKAKSKLYETQEAQKVIEANAKIAKQLEDDIVKAFEKAFLEGADLAESLKKSIKATFAKEVFRILVEPVTGKISGFLSQAGVGGGGVAGALQSLSNVATGGSAGGLLGLGLGAVAGRADLIASLGDTLFSSSIDSISNFGGILADSAASIANFAGKIAPYAGSIAALFSGNIKGAAGSAIGTYLGGAVGGPIGAAIGSFLGGKLGGGKISATALSPEFGAGVKKTLEEQYLSIVRGLGGVAANVTFNAFGNTGRQGQNPNFTLGASVNGRNVFGSAQTAEGQSDGLFLSGEIALNEANLSDQSTRAIIAVLKETNFGPEIDALFDSVNAASDSIDRLNNVLKQVDVVKFLNRNLTVFSSNIRDLVTRSAEAFTQLIETAGGTESFAQSLDVYVNTFATNSERLANAQKAVKDSFDSLNIAVPETQKELRALIDSQDLTTESGRRTYLSLINLIPAFSEVINIQNTLNQSLESVRSGTQAYIDILEGNTKSALQTVTQNILLLNSTLNNTTDVGQRLALESQLSELIFQRYQLEQQALTSVLELTQELLESVSTERQAVFNARQTISGSGALTMSASQIRSGVASAAALGSLPSTAGIDSANSEVARLNSRIQELNSTLGSQQANKVIAEAQRAASQTNLTNQIQIAKTAVSLFNQRNRVNSAFASNSSGGLASASFDDATLRAALDYAYITYNIGDEASVVALREQLSKATGNTGLFGETITGAIETANQDIFNAGLALTTARNRVQRATSDINSTTSEIEQTQQLLKVAEENRVRAQEEFVKQIQEFVIDAGKAVTRLSRLREETVKYYEAQKQLADLLNSTAANLRATVGNIRFADLNPIQQLGSLQNQFDDLFNRAQGLTGEDLAAVGSSLQGLIEPLLQKAAEVYASGSEFQRIKELVLGQALSVAEMIEQIAPKNYQEESLAILDTIDSTLALIEQNTKSAESLIVDAIGYSSDKNLEALRAVIAAINGEQIPAFSSGGLVSGRGTGTSDSIMARLSNGEYVMPANTVQQLGVPMMNSIRSGNLPVMQASGDNSELVAEIRALRRDVRETGNLNIKVVTEDGKVMMEQTITEIKERSRKGELIVYAKGVK